MYRITTNYKGKIQSPFVFPHAKAVELADNMNRRYGDFHVITPAFDNYSAGEIWQEDWTLDDVVAKIKRRL